MASSQVRTRAAIVLVVLSLSIVGTLVRAAIVMNRPSSRAELRGVALGMTARDVRDRFRPPHAGSWRALTEGEPALEWSPAAAANSDGYHARFEFHSGLLVAVRLSVPSADRDAHGAAFDVSPSAVLARRPASNGRVEVLLVARDCPTHAAEVQRLLASR